MRFFYVLLCMNTIILGCKGTETKQEKKTIIQSTKIIYQFIKPYEEEMNCTIFPAKKYDIIEERFRVFDNVFSSNIFNKIDSICAIGLKHIQKDKSIFVEHWKFKDSNVAHAYKSKLDSIPSGIRYKPPINWLWKAQKNGIVFFYSLNTAPTDSFFLSVFSDYQKLIEQENCCEQWLMR